MVPQVYQVEEVGFYGLVQFQMNQTLYFTGEKGEPGLPGPGFPGKRNFNIDRTLI